MDGEKGGGGHGLAREGRQSASIGAQLESPRGGAKKMGQPRNTVRD